MTSGSWMSLSGLPSISVPYRRKLSPAHWVPPIRPLTHINTHPQMNMGGKFATTRSVPNKIPQLNLKSLLVTNSNFLSTESTQHTACLLQPLRALLHLPHRHTSHRNILHYRANLDPILPPAQHPQRVPRPRVGGHRDPATPARWLSGHGLGHLVGPCRCDPEDKTWRGTRKSPSCVSCRRAG